MNPRSRVTPIKSVDGILGVVIMLSYLVNGKDLFPAGVNPMSYILEIKSSTGGEVLHMDDDQLTKLIDACAVAVGRPLKDLTMGSLKVYLSNLRNGMRPNGGNLPKVNTQYSSSTNRLLIAGRDYDFDVATGIWDLVPDWVRALNN